MKKISIFLIICLIFIATASAEENLTQSDIENLNKNTICDYAYSFLVGKKGVSYSESEITGLTSMLNSILYYDINDTTTKKYLDNFQSLCNIQLPTFNNIINTSINLAPINYTFNIDLCTPNLNSTITILNAKYDMDTSIPFPDINMGKASCPTIEATRWFFKINRYSDYYALSGIKLWWVLAIIIGGASIYIYRKAKRPKSRSRR